MRLGTNGRRNPRETLARHTNPLIATRPDDAREVEEPCAWGRGLSIDERRVGQIGIVIVLTAAVAPVRQAVRVRVHEIRERSAIHVVGEGAGDRLPYDRLGRLDGD